MTIQSFSEQQTKQIAIEYAKTEANSTVKIPETAIARPLIAPSTSPISIAFAVPIAWELAPKARPFDIGSSMWAILARRTL